MNRFVLRESRMGQPDKFVPKYSAHINYNTKVPSILVKRNNDDLRHEIVAGARPGSETLGKNRWREKKFAFQISFYFRKDLSVFEILKNCGSGREDENASRKHVVIDGGALGEGC